MSNQMMESDKIALLIPWYTNGTLDSHECSQVEAHLPECSSCQALLEQARLYRRVGGEPREEIPGHVHAQLLHAYVEQPRSLRKETNRWIRSHLETCRTCADASTVVAELAGPASSFSALWQTLSRSFLSPVAALAYLLVLVVGGSFLALRDTRGPATFGPEAGIISKPVRLFGETAFRRPGETPPSGPVLSISKPPAGKPLHLVLMSGLMPEDFEDEGFSLNLVFSRDEQPLWTRSVTGADMAEDGSLTLLVPGNDLHPAGLYELTLDYIQPGGDLDGRTAFTQRFTLR